MAIKTGPPPLVTNGLVFAVDAGNPRSYTSGSSTVTNLIPSVVSHATTSGSLVNQTSYSPLGGGSWEFDGTDDKITFGDAISDQVLEGSTNLTFTMWYNVSTDENSWSVPWSAGKGSTNNELSVLFYYYATSRLLFEYPAGSAEYAHTTNPKFDISAPQGIWNSFTLVCDADASQKTSCYINGAFESWNVQSGATFASVSTDLEDLCIGGNGDGSGYTQEFEGNIANFFIWNRSLTAAEILQNFESQKSRFNGYWKASF